MGNKNHTTGGLLDGDVLTGTRFELEILNPQDGRVQALPPVDPGNPTMRERLFYRVSMPELVDGAPSGVAIMSDAEHLNEVNSGLNAGQLTTMAMGFATMLGFAKTANGLV